jgi:lipopolysaccharide/colanic/teichoic acid biosynthesis glycosyltransferase
MPTGWRYRLAGVAGVACLAGGTVVGTNHPAVQSAAVALPVLGRLPATTLGSGDLALAVATTLAVVLGAVAPLFRPRPRRALDTLAVAEKRVFVAVVALAAVGYFDYTYRLPRTTLALTGVVLAVAVPLWFLAIRRRPSVDGDRAIVVGDDPETIRDVVAVAEVSVIGYVSPPVPAADRARTRVGATDGGQVSPPPLADLDCLGGLSRLETVLVERDVDTAVLAFSRPDREEFFGTLDTLYDHGVTAKVHHDHADTVLTTDVETGALVDVDLEPWDWQDYAFKRLFDVCFAAVGLVVFAPVMAAVAVAIRLDDGGPVFYRQTRTAEFGETFTVAKFRSMTPDSEDAAPGDDADRVTRVGRVLRTTHLDELPQLWAILTGRMSVVGPRAAWVDEEAHLEREATAWRKRWFVKPGLTGLAQINGVKSTDPEAKLRHDVSYIRNQSFWFDLKILVRQLWTVGVDTVRVVA